MTVPKNPKIYHIVHADRLPSIIADGYLWCDRIVRQQGSAGTTIGMNDIKDRRLRLPLSSHPRLRVGDCVPFYFCPRSVMLYLLHRGNHENPSYRGGQEPIVHLEADLHDTVEWANSINRKWAFTTSNAGSSYFDDYSSLDDLDKIDWNAVNANQWSGVKEKKQAEFLIEYSFPWSLVERIGVIAQPVQGRVQATLRSADHRPPVAVLGNWYY